MGKLEGASKGPLWQQITTWSLLAAARGGWSLPALPPSSTPELRWWKRTAWAAIASGTAASPANRSSTPPAWPTKSSTARGLASARPHPILPWPKPTGTCAARSPTFSPTIRPSALSRWGLRSFLARANFATGAPLPLMGARCGRGALSLPPAPDPWFRQLRAWKRQALSPTSKFFRCKSAPARWRSLAAGPSDAS